MSCTQISKGINASCDSSMGGLKKILIANYIENAASVTEGEISAISSAATWYEFTFRKGAASHTSTLTVDDGTGSNFVQTDLSLTFPKQETQKRIALSALATSPVMLLAYDTNGQVLFLGEQEPVQATSGGGQSGANRNDANNYTITLTDYNPEFPKFCTSAATANLTIAD